MWIVMPSCLTIQWVVMMGCSHHFKGKRYRSLRFRFQLQMGNGNKHVPPHLTHKKPIESLRIIQSLIFVSDLADSKLPVVKWPFFGHENVELNYCTSRWVLLKVRDHQKEPAPFWPPKKRLVFFGKSTWHFFQQPTFFDRNYWISLGSAGEGYVLQKGVTINIVAPTVTLPSDTLTKIRGQIKVDTTRWISLR